MAYSKNIEMILTAINLALYKPYKHAAKT